MLASCSRVEVILAKKADEDAHGLPASGSKIWVSMALWSSPPLSPSMIRSIRGELSPGPFRDEDSNFGGSQVFVALFERLLDPDVLPEGRGHVRGHSFRAFAGNRHGHFRETLCFPAVVPHKLLPDFQILNGKWLMVSWIVELDFLYLVCQCQRLDGEGLGESFLLGPVCSIPFQGPFVGNPFHLSQPDRRPERVGGRRNLLRTQWDELGSLVKLSCLVSNRPASVIPAKAGMTIYWSP